MAITIELGQIIGYLQTIGVITIIWLTIEAFSLYYNVKKYNEIKSVKKQLDRIEKKLNKKT